MQRLPRFRRSLCACLLGATLPAALAGQASISGTVYDSVSGRAFGRAVVQLVSDATRTAVPRQTAADSAGAFHIDGLTAGRYLLTFEHPRLDSLAMDASTRTVVVTDADVRADLALPSARTIASGICGAAADTTGVLLGRVLDAGTSRPAVADTVVVRWAELRLDAGGLRRVMQRVRAPVDAEGRYAACGIPTDVPVLVQAVGGDASGTIEVAFPPRVPLLHRDMLVSKGIAAARLIGHVRRADGRPFANARVVVHGEAGLDSAAVTDASGAFALDGLPSGTRPVKALSIGFAPAEGVADLRPEQTARLDLTLGTSVATLAPVTVYATRVRANSEYARHVKLGFARILKPEEINAPYVHSIADALARVPGLHIDGFYNGKPVIVGRKRCDPLFYLDGIAMSGAEEIDRYTPISGIGGVEVYEGEYAPMFYGQTGCMMILVWTKAALR